MKTKLDDLTIGEARELSAMFNPTPRTRGTRPCPFKVGDAYLIRTVTNYWTGRVEAVVGAFLVLSDAAWIADTGRYSEAKDEEHLKEVEPCDEPVFVSLGSVIDARLWTSTLPRKVK